MKIRQKSPPSLCEHTKRQPESRLQNILHVILLLLSLLFPISAFANEPVLISSFDPSPKDASQTLIITLSGAPRNVHSFILEDSKRLVIDITEARLLEPATNMPVQHPLVLRVRAAQFKPTTARVVLDLKQDVTHRIDTSSSGTKNAAHKIAVSLAPMNPGAPPQKPTLPAPPPQAVRPDIQKVHPAYTVALADTVGSAENKTLIFGDSTAQGEDQKEPSPWGQLNFSGFLLAKIAQELHESGDPEQARNFRNTVRLEGKWTPPLPGNDPAAVPGASSTFLLASLQSDYLWFGPEHSTDDYDLDLYEGYLSHATDRKSVV